MSADRNERGAPHADDPFFVGWAEAPPGDRRFFLRAGLGLTAAAGGLGFGMAALQRAPGTGTWNPDDVREWRGLVTSTPYAMLRSDDLGGGVRTALLAGEGKCGVAARLGALADQPVVVRGSLIRRGPHAMIAVADGADWIRRDERAGASAGPAFPPLEPLGPVSLAGEILDAKCWFGAMRPAEGKVHKACAALCIRGGIPPAFFARGPRAESALMILTADGRAHGPGLLSRVADPVRVSGHLSRWGDLLLLDASLDGIVRI